MRRKTLRTITLSMILLFINSSSYANIDYLQPPTRFDNGDKYFKYWAEKEYNAMLIDKYVQAVRKDLRFKGQCLQHSVELAKRLLTDGYPAVIMGMYRKRSKLPYHYYVHTEQFGAVDAYPEGHPEEPLVGVYLAYDIFGLPPASKHKKIVKDEELQDFA